MAVVIDVQPAGFADAAHVLGDTVAECVRLAWVGLTGTLDGSAGMAGTDDIGRDWGGAYDDAARCACQSTEDVANACYQLAALLEQTGRNYDGADARSAGATGEESASWVASSTSLGVPVSAVGASVPAPAGWSLLQHAIGRLWPDGHQDRLHAAGHGWQRAAGQLEDLVPDIRRAAHELTLQRAPEIEAAFAVVNGMAAHVSSLAESYRRIGASCEQFATHLDRAHSQIIGEVAGFVEWTAGIEAAAGFFAVLTLGASELGGQAAEAAEISRAASAIRSAIEALRAVVVQARLAVEAAGVRVAAVSDAVRPILARQIEQARLETANAGGAIREGEPLASQLQPAAATTPEASSVARLEAGAHIDRATESWADPATLARHFRDHGADFGASSEEDYASMAVRFFRRAVEERLPTKIDVNGTVRVYDPRTNTFGSYAADGSTKSFFKPTSPTYWERQIGEPR